MDSLKNILVVDDDETSLALLRHFINKLGHNVLIANNGDAAMEVIKRQPPDLILLDILMPIKDGHEVLKEIRKDASVRHIPIVMITVVDEFSSVVKCLKEGADDYLPKPVNETLLAARIAGCLEKKRWHDYEQNLHAELIRKYNDLKEYEKQSQKLFMAIEQIPSSIFIINNKGVIEYINAHFIKTTGYAQGEAIGQSVRILKSSPQSYETYFKILKSITQEDHWSGMVCNKKRSGERYWVYEHIHPVIDDKGELSHFVVVETEEAWRKDAQKEIYENIETLDRMLEIAENAIISIDENRKITMYNKGAERIFGYTPFEIVGNLIETLLPARFRANHGKHVANFGKSNINAKRLNERKHKLFGLRKNGEEFPAEISISKFTSKGKTVFTAVVNDISERMKLEEESFRAQKIASLGIIAGGIAHDFNNMLTTILGNANLAKIFSKAGDADKTLKNLANIEKATMRSRDLTRQLLDFSKVGETATVKKTAPINNLIREASEFAIRGSNVKCEISIPKDLWRVEMDEGQINQVINNIVINATHSMPDGGLVKVSAENIEKIGEELESSLNSGKYVKISIKDQGSGIKKEDLARIFNPYFSTKESGNGLGLASSSAIIRNHNGLITVASAQGEGSTFCVYLPASLKEVEQKAAKSGKPLAGSGKVLLMDDDDEIREMAGQALAVIGYEVDFAKDGAEAVEMYKESLNDRKPFDVVVMDLTVPCGLGAKDAIKKLLNVNPDVKAIVSSGYSDDVIMNDYEKHGFKGSVVKPFDIEELNSALLKAIKQS